MEPVRIEGQTMYATSPEGQTASMSVADVLEAACPRRLDTRGVVMPDGFRLAYPTGPFTVWVHEVSPRVCQFKWIAKDSPRKFGTGTTYRMVRVGLPYVIVLAVYEGSVLSDSNECFFRTRPLADENDELFYPALLNCSKFVPPEGKPLSWICTQKLDRSRFMGIADPARRMRGGLGALLHCLFDTGFNYSSEHHEASSWFTESNKVDRRVSTIEKWEQATGKDPLFVLDVPWLKTGLSLKQVVERIFKNKGACEHRVDSAADLARVIFNHQNGHPRRVLDPSEIPF
jgi:hypothetical protein